VDVPRTTPSPTRSSCNHETNGGNQTTLFKSTEHWRHCQIKQAARARWSLVVSTRLLSARSQRCPLLHPPIPVIHYSAVAAIEIRQSISERHNWCCLQSQYPCFQWNWVAPLGRYGSGEQQNMARGNSSTYSRHSPNASNGQ